MKIRNANNNDSIFIWAWLLVILIAILLCYWLLELRLDKDWFCTLADFWKYMWWVIGSLLTLLGILLVVKQLSLQLENDKITKGQRISEKIYNELNSLIHKWPSRISEIKWYAIFEYLDSNIDSLTSPYNMFPAHNDNHNPSTWTNEVLVSGTLRWFTRRFMTILKNNKDFLIDNSELVDNDLKYFSEIYKKILSFMEQEKLSGSLNPYTDVKQLYVDVVKELESFVDIS